jgi:hypothetical protein
VMPVQSPPRVDDTVRERRTSRWPTRPARAHPGARVS